MFAAVERAHFKTDVVIIGAGLAGLTLAFLLKDSDLDFRVLEARQRPGGRILTQYVPDGAPIELGATWFGNKHRELSQLIRSLKLEVFEQHTDREAIFQQAAGVPPQRIPIPPNPEPSYRVAGGTMSLIEKLLAYVASDRIHWGERVASIAETGNGVLVKSEDMVLHTRYAVSTLPPRLLDSSIRFKPELPESLASVAENTQTWMGESIKVGLRYARPFWRNEKASGTIFSHRGPIVEMYDHSDVSNDTFALKGFLNPGLHALSKEERKVLAIRQLQGYYGPQAKAYLSYEEMVWRTEAFTRAPGLRDLAPHQNNGHPIYGQAYMDGKLFIAGSETATEYAGYMEGAVRSALRVYHMLS